MKKIFYLLILIIIFIPRVYAADYDYNFGSSPEYWIYYGDDIGYHTKATYGDNYHLVPKWDGAYYSAPFVAKNDTYYSQQLGIKYGTRSFCNGDSVTLNGTIYLQEANISAKNARVFASGGTSSGDTLCESKMKSNTEIDFVCTFNSIQNKVVQIYLDNLDFSYLEPKGYRIDLMFGIYHYMGVTCNPSNASVITNQNNNKNEIINNQNENTNAINNSIDDMKEKQDETNNLISSDEVDTSGANSFFGDFSDTDHGGISGVVTAPLRFINNLTGTCKPISFDVLGADVELPCGDTLFWNKPEVESFRVIWNVLFGGGILYLLVTKLFKVIEGLKNPDDSRIEVMKL